MAEPSKAEKLITLLQEIESLEEQMKSELGLLGLEAATMGVGSKFVKKGMPKGEIDEIIEDEAYSIIDRVEQEDFEKMFPKRELTSQEMYDDFLKEGYVDSPEFSMTGRRPDSKERMGKAVEYYKDQLKPLEKEMMAKAAQDTATGYKQLSSLALPVIPTLDALYGSYTKRSDLLKQADELKGQLSPEDLQDVERRLMEARPKYGQAAPAIRPSTEEQRKAATHKGQERPEQPVSPSSVGKGLSEEQRKQVEDFLLKMEK